MSKRCILLIFITCILMFTFGCSKNSENIIKGDKGEINLSNFDFYNNKEITLSGTWKLYWNQFVNPGEVNDNINFSYINVPNSWTTKNIDGQILKSYGYGTLVLDAKLDPNIKRYAIETIYLTSAFKIYANGKLVASNGEIGKDEMSMVPQWTPVVGFFETPSDGNVEFVIQFSNFNNYKIVLKDIYIGTDSNIEIDKNLRSFFDIFAFGCIFTMGCYHLILYCSRRSDKVSFYFSFLCIIFAIRSLLVEQRVIYLLFPHFPWSVFMKVALMTTYLMAPFIGKFILEVLGKKNNIFLNIIQFASIIFSLVIIFTKPKQFMITLTIYQVPLTVFMFYLIIVLIKAVRKKQQSSLVLLIGYVSFVAIMVRNLLFENNIVGRNSFDVLGMIFLILTQAFMLGSKFSRNFKKIEVLVSQNIEINKQLKIYSENLEDIVEERTNELVESNSKLETLNFKLKNMIAYAKLSERKFKSLFENVPEGVFRYILDQGFVLCNPAMAKMLAYDETGLKERMESDPIYPFVNEEEKNKFINCIINNTKIDKLQLRMKRKDNSTIIVEISAHVLSNYEDYLSAERNLSEEEQYISIGEAYFKSMESNDMKPVFIEGIVSDITDRKLMEEELKRLVTTDTLTNLYNRRYFMEQFESSFNDAVNNKKKLSLIMFDIDFFKSINDTYGHDIGDKVICQVARISRGLFEENVVVARFGGEEFIVLLKDADETAAFEYGEKLRKSIEEFDLIISDNKKVNFKISVGVTTLNSKIQSMDELLKRVDVALYKAKNNGRNIVERK